MESNWGGVSGVVNKVVMKSECLKELFSELDSSSEVMEILMSPNAPHFRISTFGNHGENHVRFIVFNAFLKT